MYEMLYHLLKEFRIFIIIFFKATMNNCFARSWWFICMEIKQRITQWYIKFKECLRFVCPGIPHAMDLLKDKTEEIQTTHSSLQSRGVELPTSVSGIAYLNFKNLNYQTICVIIYFVQKLKFVYENCWVYAQWYSYFLIHKK